MHSAYNAQNIKFRIAKILQNVYRMSVQKASKFCLTGGARTAAISKCYTKMVKPAYKSIVALTKNSWLTGAAKSVRITTFRMRPGEAVSANTRF